MERPTKRDALRILRRVPLFSALSETDRVALLAECRGRRAAAGTELVSAGEAADRFYVIVRGRVKLYQLSARGDEQILHLYGSGATFGEAAMWLGQAFPAYAETVEETALLVVPREVLETAIQRRPEIARGMLAGLSLKLREFNRLIEQLSLREVPARLATVLLELAGEAGSSNDQSPSSRHGSSQLTVVLPSSKRELAAQIGTIPETLSRAFAKLSRAGLIEVAGRRIRILDREGLRDVADG